MKKTLTKITLLFLLVQSFHSFSQYRFEFGGGLGVANYLGDIGGGSGPRKNFLGDLKMGATRQAVNVFFRYKLLPGISFKTELSYFRITGDDKNSANIERHLRNLNFVNDMVELSFQGQIKLFEDPSINSNKRFRIGMRVYIGGGFGFFSNNPKAITPEGNIPLRPLTTEGVNYAGAGLCLPAVTGVYFTLKKYHRISWELNWRTTFTDYLDDVSYKYADPTTLSPLGVKLYSRTNELEDASSYGIELTNFENGSKRGDHTHNDAYLTMNFSYSYVLRGQSSFYRSKYGSFFSKTAKKGRKIRAKF